MELVLPRSWKEEFERAAMLKREELVYNDKMHRFEIRERERREEHEKAQEVQEREEWQAWEEALAPAADIAEYRVEFYSYDTKTIEALMDNREANEANRRKIEKMIGDGTMLPDGRKVFKTMDGLRVCDENGQAISFETIDPASIDDKKPRWEMLKAAKEESVRLEIEHQQLIEYQAKLDAARERLDKGDITNGELKDLKAELAKDMPDAVRAKLGLEKPNGTEPVAEQKADQKAAATAALPANMDNLVRQTGFAAP